MCELIFEPLRGEGLVVLVGLLDACAGRKREKSSFGMHFVTSMMGKVRIYITLSIFSWFGRAGLNRIAVNAVVKYGLQSSEFHNLER